MKNILIQFDIYLSRENLTFEAVVIGGAALILTGAARRTTNDVDCLAPEIPAAVKAAARDFALANPALELDTEWLNNGPASLTEDLPKGWAERTAPLFEGTALRLRTLGRLDLLRTKLFAYCDRQQDFGDCLALAPTDEELSECRTWVEARDAHPDWPAHVMVSFGALRERLNHGPNR